MTIEFVKNWLLAMFTSSWIPKRYVAASYALGEGIKKDERLARKWYARAAQAGDMTSDYDLALMFLYGEGGPVEIEKGKILLESVANKGQPSAQKVLAYFYRDGLYSFPKDEQKYVHWKKLAELQGMKV